MKQQYDLLVRLDTICAQIGNLAQRMDGILYDYQTKQEAETLEDIAINLDTATRAITALHYALGARLSDYRNIRGQQ